MPESVPGVPICMTGNPAGVRGGLARALRRPPLCRLPPDDRAMAELVLAEVLNNIAEHAYAGAPGRIRLYLMQVPCGLDCRVEDEGCAMPGGRLPGGFPPPPMALAEGGYGWHLIRTLAHGLRYERRGKTNRLSFTLGPGR